MNCKVCKGEIKTQGFYAELRERLEKTGVCFSCDTWVSHWQDRNNPEVVRIDGNHYMMVNDGSGFELTFRRNGKLITSNVWHQGTIPEVFRNALPDNAHYARRIQVA